MCDRCLSGCGAACAVRGWAAPQTRKNNTRQTQLQHTCTTTHAQQEFVQVTVFWRPHGDAVCLWFVPVCVASSPCGVVLCGVTRKRATSGYVTRPSVALLCADSRSHFPVRVGRKGFGQTPSRSARDGVLLSTWLRCVVAVSAWLWCPSFVFSESGMRAPSGKVARHPPPPPPKCFSPSTWRVVHFAPPRRDSWYLPHPAVSIPLGINATILPRNFFFDPGLRRFAFPLFWNRWSSRATTGTGSAESGCEHRYRSGRQANRCTVAKPWPHSHRWGGARPKERRLLNHSAPNGWTIHTNSVSVNVLRINRHSKKHTAHLGNGPCGVKVYPLFAVFLLSPVTRLAPPRPPSVGP